MGEFTKEQMLLMRIRDERCGGNGAELARKIGKEASYVHRLLYPIGKSGRKGIGLEIMQACTSAFDLPPGYWDGADEPSQWPFDGVMTAAEWGKLPHDVKTDIRKGALFIAGQYLTDIRSGKLFDSPPADNHQNAA